MYKICVYFLDVHLVSYVEFVDVQPYRLAGLPLSVGVTLEVLPPSLAPLGWCPSASDKKSRHILRFKGQDPIVTLSSLAPLCYPLLP